MFENNRVGFHYLNPATLFLLSSVSWLIVVVKLNQARAFAFNCSLMLIITNHVTSKVWLTFKSWLYADNQTLHWRCRDWLELKLITWIQQRSTDYKSPHCFHDSQIKEPFCLRFFTGCHAVLKEAPTEVSEKCNLHQPLTSVTHQRCSQGLPPSVKTNYIIEAGTLNSAN